MSAKETIDLIRKFDFDSTDAARTFIRELNWRLPRPKERSPYRGHNIPDITGNPKPLAEVNHRIWVVQATLKFPLVELLFNMSWKRINMITNSHSVRCDDLVMKSTGLTIDFIKGLASLVPKDEPAVIFGGKARQVMAELRIREGERRIKEKYDSRRRESIYSYFDADNHWSPNAIDVDIAIPDRPDVIEYIKINFPDAVFQKSRGASDILRIATVRSKEGKEIQFHIFKDGYHPVIRVLSTAMNFSNTLMITINNKECRLVDLLGVSADMETHRIEIPMKDWFKKYTKDNGYTWRMLNTCIMKLLRIPVDGFSVYNEMRDTIEEIIGVYVDQCPSPEQAASLCSVFTKDLNKWRLFNDMNKNTLRILGETGVLKILIKAAFISKNIEILKSIRYFLYRTIEYLDLPDNPEKRKILLEEIDALGYSEIQSSEGLIEFCGRLLNTDPAWFKKIRTVGNDYHNPHSSGWSARKYLEGLFEINWHEASDDVRKASRDRFSSETESWPEGYEYVPNWPLIQMASTSLSVSSST